MTKAIEALTPFVHRAQNACFGCGPANPTGLQLEFFQRPDGSVVCPANVPERFEGLAGYLHGGVIATLLDEIMSKAVRARGRSGMTRHMEIDYLRPVPSKTPIRLEAHITHSEGRKHWVHGCVLTERETVLARGKALFVEVRPRDPSAKPPE
jgi:uncharacterized protein (TIGR00369 family)